MLYEPHETEISERYLTLVLGAIKEPACLLGGWAVNKTVDDNFRRGHGRGYLGSRDIDIGFHINPNASVDELKTTDFALALTALEKANFELVGFRLVKRFDVETRRELNVEEAKTKPPYMTFELYADPVVDRIPRLAKAAFGFIPIDEPILSEVFEKKAAIKIEMVGKELLLPLPHVLLATKLRSVLNRDKEHKRVKDVADIYALAWHSGLKLASLKEQLRRIVPKEETKNIIEKLDMKDLQNAATATGVDKAEITRVLRELAA